MTRWCRVYACDRKAAEGSEFCRVKHGWDEVKPAPPAAPIVRGTRRRWTRGAVIAAIDLWVAEHGRPPTSLDWARASDAHPCSSTAVSIFGTWSDAIRAAGHVPAPAGRPPLGATQ